MQSLIGRLVLFAVCMTVYGLVISGVAYAARGLLGLEGACYSLLLCLIPGFLTIVAAELLRHPDVSPYVVLVGTGVRMVFVLLGLYVVSELRPRLGFYEFVVWLIPSYIVALVVETAIVLATPASVDSSVLAQTDAVSEVGTPH